MSRPSQIYSSETDKIGKFVNKLQFYEQALLTVPKIEFVPDYIDLNLQTLKGSWSILFPFIERLVNLFIRQETENIILNLKIEIS